jgi:hypothetical protein
MGDVVLMARRRALFGKSRSELYGAAKLMGDVNAIQRGTVVKRVVRRLVGRFTGRIMGRLFR